MNKQELIKKYKRLEGVWNAEGAEIARQIFLQDLQQLDEPEKVKIPQFVAEYIEQKKDDDYHLLGAMDTIMTSRRKNLYEWFYDDDNMELFARAWLDGYEVEKEKQYIIKLKGVPDGAKFLKYAKVTQEWYFGMKGLYSDREIIHTRKELEEANFGWVFNCEGIEVEEVKE